MSVQQQVLPLDAAAGRTAPYRGDHLLVAGLVEPGSKVLDVGCGDGDLLQLLESRGIDGRGIELSREGVNRCVAKGLAVVQGDPPASGTIDVPIGRDMRARTRMTVTHRGKEARTAYRVLERYGRAALVECRLETGRTHQIRVHFQHIRHPLVGDETYRRGTRHGISFARQALHATELTLLHPQTRKVVSWRSPLPRDMKRLVDGLRDQA